MTDELDLAAGPPGNPFPPAAIAVLDDASSTASTVPTTSVLAARGIVDDFLGREHPEPGGDPDDVAGTAARPAAEPAETAAGLPRGSGEVVMVSGEPGSGKTHLVNEIIHRVRHPADASRVPARCVPVSAHGHGFYQTYRESFIRHFDYEDTIQLVVDVYARVVADRLAERGARLADHLRDGSADPRDVVQRLGQQNLFLSRLQETVPKIVGPEDFGRVLPLLLHPRLDMAAWEWLQGLPPAQPLRERGVAGPLSEAGALQAMGAFATLHGWLGRRFVLVMDDLEKVLTPDREPPPQSARPLRGLLDTYLSVGGMLVLSGLPEFFEVLPEDVPSRIRTQIVPTPMTDQDVRRFIDLRRRHYDGPTLDFSGDAVQEIVRLTGGAPRPVLRLCHQAYQIAAPKERPVDVHMVHEAARQRLGTAQEPAAEVRAHLERVLSAKGWRFRTDHVLRPSVPGQGEPVRVDYWVPILAGAVEGGCAIEVTGAVLQQADADRLRRWCRAVRAERPERRALVIVAEYLADDLRRGLAEDGGIEPIVYQTARFPDMLHDRLESVFARLGDASAPAARAPASGAADMSVLREQLDRMGRQVSHTQDGMAELAVRLEEMWQQSDQRWRELRENVRRLPAPGAVPATRDPRLDPELARLFDRALAWLSPVDTVAEMVGEAFDVSSRRSDPAGQLLVRRLRRNNTFEAIGVAITLRGLLEAFRRAVAGWLDDTRGRALDDDDRARLDSVCDTYEAIYQTVPLSSLDRLGDLTGYGGTPDVPSRGDRSSRQLAIVRALDGLGGLVRSTAWQAAQSAERP